MKVSFKELIASTGVENQITASILTEAVEEINKANRERLQQVLVQHLGAFQKQLQAFVMRLRNLRKEEKKLSVLVRQINTALENFGKTGNPFPVFKVMYGIGAYNIARQFCEAANIEMPEPNDELWNG